MFFRLAAQYPIKASLAKQFAFKGKPCLCHEIMMVYDTFCDFLQTNVV